MNIPPDTIVKGNVVTFETLSSQEVPRAHKPPGKGTFKGGGRNTRSFKLVISTPAGEIVTLGDNLKDIIDLRFGGSTPGINGWEAIKETIPSSFRLKRTQGNTWKILNEDLNSWMDRANVRRREIDKKSKKVKMS